MAQIAFLTLFLGLVSGRQPVELQAEPAVVALRLELDGKTVAELQAPPWRTTIDFGAGLAPQELVAVGLDGAGREVGRTSQAINLPRPVAEAEIVLQHDAAGTPVGAEVSWRHLLNQQPKHMTLMLDGRTLTLDQSRAAFPKLDLATPHVIAAEVDFPDGNARKEIVIGGTLPESAGSQLTATAVMETGTAPVPSSLDGCFTFNGQPVRAQAIEKSEAFVILVRDPSPLEAISALIPPTAHRTLTDRNLVRLTATLDLDTRSRLLWPVPDKPAAPGAPASTLFPFTGDFGVKEGLLWLLIASHENKNDHPPRQFADAVAVAGVQAMTGARRRAVILAIGNANDASRYKGPAVRRYLASIGVPLFVWSLTGVRPELTAVWGDVADISGQAKLRDATELVKKTLAAQRIVWLDADPIHALRATVKESCGLKMVAGH